VERVRIVGADPEAPADVADVAGVKRLEVNASLVPGPGTPDVNVTDRAARLLGEVASIAAPVDVSDRAARALGVVASIAAPVDVSDRAVGASSAFLYRLRRPTTAPPFAGGTTIAAQRTRTSDPAAVAIVRSEPTTVFAYASATEAVWKGSAGLLLTLAGAAIPSVEEALRIDADGMGVILLAPGEGIVFSADGNDAAWRHWGAFTWDESVD
jgi:hypothetical protein